MCSGRCSRARRATARGARRIRGECRRLSPFFTFDTAQTRDARAARETAAEPAVVLLEALEAVGDCVGILAWVVAFQVRPRDTAGLARVGVGVLGWGCWVLHYITLHYATLRYSTVQYSTVQYITVHYITLH